MVKVIGFIFNLKKSFIKKKVSDKKNISVSQFLGIK